MINREYDEKILAWIEKNKNSIIEDWMELVRIPSVLSPAEDGAPFGAECAKALRKAVEKFSSRGLSARISDDGKYGIAEYGNGKNTIGLFGHSDVVPAGDGWIYTEPFSPVIIDGTLIGRGVSDNKSGIMISLCVMSLLKECEIPASSRILAFIGSNEECGMEDIHSFVKNEKMPDLCIVPDGGFPCCTGEKGILHMWMESAASLSDIIDFHGGDAYNIVLERADITIRKNPELAADLAEKISGNSNFSISTDDDGNIHLLSIGSAKHAAYPEGSVNAAIEAAKLLSGCQTLAADDRQVMASAAKLLSSYYGDGMGIAHEDNNFGLLTLANGMVKVEGGKISFSADIRYGASLEPDVLESTVRRSCLENGWAVTYLSNNAGFDSDENSPIPDILEKTYREVTEKSDATNYRISGGTYSRYLKNAFSVGVNAYVKDTDAKIPDMPQGHGREHQKDECIVIDEFFQAIRVIAHMIIECDKAINQ